MDKKVISITKIKPEMTQCRLIQLQKEQEKKEKKDSSKTCDTENGKRYE